MTSEETKRPLTEDEALALATEAVELAGGTRQVYRNPRHPFALNPTSDYDVEGHSVELRHGEISSPAIDSVKGIFVEGSPVYEDSGFFHKTHVQICVCNPDCIKGVFRVPDRFLA